MFSLNMGLTGTENAVLLATEKTDLSLAQGIISVSVGGTVTQMSTVNDMPSSLVGMRGVLLTGKDGRVCGFVAGRYEPVSVVVKSRDADGINTTEGGRIFVLQAPRWCCAARCRPTSLPMWTSRPEPPCSSFTTRTAR